MLTPVILRTMALVAAVVVLSPRACAESEEGPIRGATLLGRRLRLHSDRRWIACRAERDTFDCSGRRDARIPLSTRRLKAKLFGLLVPA